jgi:hypothetical protein
MNGVEDSNMNTIKKKNYIVSPMTSEPLTEVGKSESLPPLCMELR